MKYKNRIALILISFVSCITCFSQNNLPNELASKILTLKFHDELVSVLIKSKKGEENIKKPLFLYVQGSMDRPLIINYPDNNDFKYSIAFPFSIEKILEKYHIAVISKPYIPVVANIESLDNSYNYIDSATKKIPSNFSKNNNL